MSLFRGFPASRSRRRIDRRIDHSAGFPENLGRFNDLVLQRSVTAAGAARVVLTLRDETGMKQLVRRTQGAMRAGKPGWAELRRTAANATDGVPVVTGSVAMQTVRDKALQ